MKYLVGIVKCNDLEPKIEAQISVDDSDLPCQGNLRLSGINKTRPWCLLLEDLPFLRGTLISSSSFRIPAYDRSHETERATRRTPVLFEPRAKSQELKALPNLPRLAPQRPALAHATHSHSDWSAPLVE